MGHRMATDRLIAGRYRLRAEIGRGGMGVVWLAEDELLGREIALKRIGYGPGSAAPDAARAAREARLAATLSHAHVVAVFDLAHEGDQQWLVMEHVEGVDLGRLVRERGALDPDTSARLLSQAADALAAAHRAGIVHRDVKPSNMLVTSNGQVKLTDFGIARGEADATLTATGLMTGSPAYLAPEVASGSPARPASDVWSLGATLFHALTGTAPYEVSGNVIGALYRIVHEDPPRPRDAGWLAPLLEATMTKDPSARWSMAEVAAFLARGPHEPKPQPQPPPQPRPQARPQAKPQAQAQTQPDPRPQPLAQSQPDPRRDPPVDRRRRPWALMLAAALVLAAIVLGGAVVGRLLTGGTPTAGEQTGSASPTEEPSPDNPATDGVVTAREIRKFTRDYLKTVTSDPQAGWDSLTPAFQAESGGFEGYNGWWSQVDSARLDSVDPDPDQMAVSYTVTYSMVDGSTRSDQVSLRLVDNGERLLIDGES